MTAGPNLFRVARICLTGRLKAPFHREARLVAGFSAAELAWLESMG